MAPTARFEHLTVVLSRAPAVEAAFEQLLADQINPKSTRYHQWLTPAQVGALYGPAQSDVDAVSKWLQSQGLAVNSVSPNRLFVDFSGPVASVESAFGTSFRLFSLANGEQRYSLTQEPTIPAAIQPVVATIAGLSETIHRSNAKRGTFVPAQSGARADVISPQYTTSGGTHYLLSGDFNTAYDITPVLAAGTTGTGQNVAVAGLSRVYPNDIAQLQTMEGLTVKQPNVIIPTSGIDPGTTNAGDQGEATLDVDRVSGTAPGATVDLVVSGNIGQGNTYATDGLYIAINYAISTVNDPILSISFGGCEALNGSANDTYEASIFQTAASQGITTFISSGDSGAAACNAFYTSIPTTQVLSINDLCANQYVTCVGGTEFAADSTTSTNYSSSYWSASNSSTFTSLQSYIPEGAWNDPVLYQGTYNLSGGSGGGTSVFLSRPTWQTGTGVPAGSFRLVPDVSFTSSANHDGFVVCLNYDSAACAYTGTTITNADVYGGTSAAAPSMAGIQALANQKLGGRQGNINPVLYGLGGSSNTALHDVTVASSGVSSCVPSTPSICNNSTPSSASLAGGLAGYTVTAGYDEATGLGSLDVAKYLTAVSTSSFTLSPAATTLSVAPTSGATTTDVIYLQSVAGFSGAVGLTCTVVPSGSATGTCSVSPAAATLTSGGNASATLTVTSTSSSTGTLLVTVKGTSGATINTSPAITVLVANSSFTLSPASTSLNFTSGATSGNSTTLTVNSVSGYSGTVGLGCTISSSSASFQPSCSVSPPSVSLTAGGTATAVVSISSSPAVQAANDRKAAPLGWRLGGGATLALLFCCIPLRRRRLTLGSISLLGVLALGFASITGCSSSATATLTTRSSAGSYTVTVTGTGTTTATTTVAVTIR